MAPFRAAILTNFIPPYRAPAFRALTDYVERLDVHVDVRMEANRPWDVDWNALHVSLGRGISLSRKPRSQNPSEETVAPSVLHLSFSVLPFLRRTKPDIVVSSEFGFRTIQAALFSVVNRRTTLIVWATLSNWTERNRSTFQGALRRLILKVAHGVICNGRDGASYISSINSSIPIKIVNQVAHPDYHQLPDNETVVAYDFVVVGQLVPAKGIPYLLEAVRRLDRCVSVALIGSGPEEYRLKRLSADYGLDCSFHGELSRPDVARVLKRCRYLVFPTLADEWGLVVNEALSLGLPVIGSRFSQAVLELIDSNNGWTVDPTNVESLRATLEEAWNLSEEQYEQLQIGARRSVAKLTPTYFAEEFVSFFRELSRQS